MVDSSKRTQSQKADRPEPQFILFRDYHDIDQDVTLEVLFVQHVTISAEKLTCIITKAALLRTSGAYAQY